MANSKDISAKVQKIANEARATINRIAADALNQIKEVQAGATPTNRSLRVSN